MISADKPFIDQMTDMAKDARASIPEVPALKDASSSASSSVQSMGDSIIEMKDGVKSSLSDFSNKSVMNASTEFLDSNSLLAKLSFIVLVLIVFMLLLKLMMSLVGYFVSPSANPYIISGSLEGSNTATITQQPGKDTTIEILRSNDRTKGMEYTWSTWLYLTAPTSATLASNIFVKGSNTFDPTSGISHTNGPGMYVKTKTDTTSNALSYNLYIVIDHIGVEAINVTNETDGRDNITVENIPIKKWVHVALRLSNMIMDVYINGTIAKRHNMDTIPKQNSSDIIVSGNKGFPGKLSNLRYYSYALNVFELNNIVMGGPTLTPSKLSSDSAAASGNYSYLSNQWYNSGY
jgi:hypothetical protein